MASKLKKTGEAGLTAECEGEVSTLGSIKLDTPLLVLVTGEMILESTGSGITNEITNEDTVRKRR